MLHWSKAVNYVQVMFEYVRLSLSIFFFKNKCKHKFSVKLVKGGLGSGADVDMRLPAPTNKNLRKNRRFYLSVKHRSS